MIPPLAISDVWASPNSSKSRSGPALALRAFVARKAKSLAFRGLRPTLLTPPHRGEIMHPLYPPPFEPRYTSPTSFTGSPVRTGHRGKGAVPGWPCRSHGLGIPRSPGRGRRVASGSPRRDGAAWRQDHRTGGREVAQNIPDRRSSAARLPQPSNSQTGNRAWRGRGARGAGDAARTGPRAPIARRASSPGRSPCP